MSLPEPAYEDPVCHPSLEVTEYNRRPEGERDRNVYQLFLTNPRLAQVSETNGFYLSSSGTKIYVSTQTPVLGPFIQLYYDRLEGKRLDECLCTVTMRHRFNYFGTMVSELREYDCPVCHDNPLVKWEDEDSKGPEGERISDIRKTDIFPYRVKETKRQLERALPSALNTIREFAMTHPEVEDIDGIFNVTDRLKLYLSKLH